MSRFAAALAWLALAATAAPATSPAASSADSVRVVLLGTGMPLPDHTAQGPATAVLVGSRLFLFDAGAGVERQMEAAGLEYRGGPVTAAFLTHLHSDHTLGLPDLILTSWVMGRRAPLPIVGPPGTQRMIDHILAAWSEDIQVREAGLEHESVGGWKVSVRETQGGVVYDSAGVRVTAIPVLHGSWRWAFGYRIDARGRSIVISGDTRPCPALERASRGVDVLVHEVYPASRLRSEPRPGGGDWPRYMRAFHTSDRELGALCARAQPRLLVLTHLMRMGGTDAELLAGIRAGGFRGHVEIGHDLARY
ncbi:MAG TPA: MBL fold metallo-hydrolase [Polyangiaceae bacterium]|nr:MBL fold metallo-hydrolase [Polyangiaceae bacterium]